MKRTIERPEQTGTGAGACECDNCSKQWSQLELNDIQDYAQRVGVGCTAEPMGECPECGALCYEVSDGN
jgi:hypothetical protein